MAKWCFSNAILQFHQVERWWNSWWVVAWCFPFDQTYASAFLCEFKGHRFQCFLLKCPHVQRSILLFLVPRSKLWCFPINYHSYLDSYSKFYIHFFHGPRSKVYPTRPLRAALGHCPGTEEPETSLAPGSAGGLRAQPRTMAGITGKMMRNPWGFWPEKNPIFPSFPFRIPPKSWIRKHPEKNIWCNILYHVINFLGLMYIVRY